MSLSRPVRTLAALAAATGLVLGVTAGSQAVLAPVPGSERGPDTLFPTQGNGGYDVRSYHVRLAYQPRRHHLDAVTTIAARAQRPLSSFSLDFVGMRVRAVRVDGSRASFARHGHELVVTPRRAVRGAFTTTVSYTGKPRDHTDPDDSQEGWVRTPDGATALGEPVGAMTWLPSNNTPGDKATYTFRVTAPARLKVAANGVLARRTTHGARTTWVWRETAPMATYLAIVSIGKYDLFHSSMRSVTGRRIPIWSFVDPTTEPSARARRLLPKVIRFEERIFGRYPFRSAGMIIDNADVGYALETQDRPFYPFDADTATLVHETAHQWYGDSVTLTDWHDIWLAEGFATYAEWLWEAAHGGATPARQFDKLYAKPAGNPLWHPAPTGFTDPADLFGAQSYNRGAMTLQALREQVGRQDFFRILRAWATQHRHGSVRTAQFVKLSEKVSGQQLDTLFADWLAREGKPAGY